MRVFLVAMPWSPFDMPNPALGVLTAHIRRELPHIDVSPLYAYVDVASELESIYVKLSDSDLRCELLYAALLFPEQREDVEHKLGQVLLKAGMCDTLDAGRGLCRYAIDVLDRHLDELASACAEQADVVGFTTTYSQLFSSIAACRRIKTLSPSTLTVLGGASIEGNGVAASILDVFPCVDYVVRGEGEIALVDLLRRIERGDTTPLPVGVAARRDGTGVEETPAEVVEPLDGLPVPDYTEFFDAVEGRIYSYFLPIEGARGCWWHRTQETGDPMRSCHFCSLGQGRYREKSAARIAAEMTTLSERHSNVRFLFADNSMRVHGVEELAAALEREDGCFEFFCEIRANTSPRDLVRLKAAGCRLVQLGLEGLSTGYLRRIGKGTSTIRNLLVMKTCLELGVRNMCNLLPGFPGATAAEVEETVHNIEHYAIAYDAPRSISRFRLYRNSPMAQHPELFKLAGLRNHAAYRTALPDDLFADLKLPALDYDDLNEPRDWTPVVEAVDRWRERRRRLRNPGSEAFEPVKPLVYYDGGSFLEVIDRRSGYQIFQMDADWRAVYLACAGIADEKAIRNRFEPRLGGAKLGEILHDLLEERLLFQEGSRYLALAAANRPETAIDRILSAPRPSGQTHQTPAESER